MTEPMLTEAEIRTEIERLNLIGANWIRRHGRSDRRLFDEFMQETIKSDPRLREAAVAMTAQEFWQQEVAAGRLIRIGKDRFMEPWRFLAYGIAGRPAAQ
jgi:hypothetical protein